MQPQYRDYNEIAVTLFKEKYIVSNIHKQYGKNDNAHLQSLSVEVPSFETKDAASTGYKGSLSIVDYRNVLFTKFVTFQTENKGKQIQIPIEIEIKCFTGNKSFYGVVDEWQLTFTGSVPSIEIQWKAFPMFPSSADLDGTYTNPSGFIDAAVQLLKSPETDSPKKCVYIDPSGSAHESGEFDSLFKFQYPENIGYVVFRAASISASNGTIYAALKFFVENARLASDESAALTYNYNVKDSAFEIRQVAPEANQPTDKGDNPIKELAFILNGSKPAYSKDETGKYIIPMTAFSFNSNHKDAILQYSINSNMNGSTIAKDGAGATSSNAPTEVLESTVSSDTKSVDAGKTEISFDCYNVMAFCNNDVNAKIYFRLFTEFGEEHPITAGNENNRYATVTSVSYDLSGAVVRASVKATQVYNTKVEQKIAENTKAPSVDNKEGEKSA